MSESIIDKLEKEEVEFVDLKFCDISGTWNHLTIPAKMFGLKAFEEGIGFDGSSIRGWQNIEVSDMLLVPDAGTAFLDPFLDNKTLSLICDVRDTDKSPYSFCPRSIARKAEAQLSSSQIADTAYFGPEAEFFIFDDIQYEVGLNESFYKVDSAEAAWNTGREECPNQGHKIRYREGYLPVSPADQNVNLRGEMVSVMMKLGLEVECQHHEVASGGQAEIDLRYNRLLKMADHMCVYKYVVKNVAHRNGKSATFMPKPIFGDNGSGMHVHQSLWKGDQPLFSGELYAHLSQEALWYIGGLLHHAPALCAITNPTSNSYKRLVPGYEAPVTLAYSARNRSVICRIPAYSSDPKAVRVEFRCPDPSANPYLAFSALLLAGLDGIKNKIDPGEAVDRNMYEASKEEIDRMGTVPPSLYRALKRLEADKDFLIDGNVFTEDFINNYLRIKRKECDQMALHPHPYEFALYYDI